MNIKLLFFMQLVLVCIFQIVYAGEGVVIKSAKKERVSVYSGPSSDTKTEETVTPDLVNGKIVKSSGMNGRFLKIIIDKKDIWIKAKEVNTSKVYDVGACEKQNKVTGVRGAVNCTE